MVSRVVNDLHRAAFSMIELVVCIGVITLLLGLLLPSLHQARARAKLTRADAIARSCFIAVASYTNEHGETFPVAAPGVASSMLRWYEPIILGGGFPSVEAIDTEGVEETGSPRFAMSACFFYPMHMMEVGATVPIQFAETTGIRQSDVLFPSKKGAIVQWLHVETGRHVFWTCNEADRPISPVAFADGSVMDARCTDFVLEHDFFENWVGHPVLSAWHGAHGIDRTQ